MTNKPSLSRRDFLARAALATTTAALCRGSALSVFGAGTWPPQVAVFSKVYQELKLDFDQAAELTAQAGLDGVDCPVRPKGEIEPERAAEDMPRYAEALRKRNVGMLLLTTGITSVSSPHAEDILRTAKKLGIRIYRLGSALHPPGQPADKLVAEVRAQLKELAALNKQLGLAAVIQNHSPSGRRQYAGGDLAELHEIMKGFEPEQIGVAFDLGHALVVHGDEWPAHFERLKPHIRVAYIKDMKRPRQFLAFGEGEFGKSDYFKRLKQLNLASPLSMHIEYEWCPKGQEKTRAALLKVLKDSHRVLRQWLAAA
ncbi:MAG: sugar phosphate isomerase/epimerase [Verrucomicrobia bacterium]|nr:sugar phosphate isomerase/epimerase [Verrucomicrobiota bacterium]